MKPALTLFILFLFVADAAARSDPEAAPRLWLLDVTADGLPDKLLAGGAGRGHDSLSVAIGLGGRTWQPIHQELPRVDIAAVLCADLDADGHLDLYLVSPGTNVALTGDGTGRFVDATARLGLGDAGRGCAAEARDLDGDGHPDVLLHNTHGDVLFWSRAGATFDRDGGTRPAPPGVAAAGAGSPLLHSGSSLPAPGGAPVDAAEVAIELGLLLRLDERYVNDGAGEVDASDVADGSLTGADLSSVSGDVDIAGGVLTATSPDPSRAALTGQGGNGNFGDGRDDGGPGMAATGGGGGGPAQGRGGPGLLAQGGGGWDGGGHGLVAAGGAGFSGSGSGVIAVGADNLDDEAPGLGVDATGGFGIGGGGTGLRARGGAGELAGGTGVSATGGSGPLTGGGTGVRGVGGTGAPAGGHGGVGIGAAPGGHGVKGSASDANSYGVLAEGDLAVTGVKAFVHPHPSDPSKEIRFAALEGPESGTYFRGTVRLVDGVAVIAVPEAFALVTDPTGLTTHLTPLGAPADLWIEAQSLEGIVVRGRPDVDVQYLVQGARRGFDDLPVVRENRSFVPTVRGEPFGLQYRAAYRELLVANGILNPDYTPNEATAARLGWALRDAPAP